MAQDNRAPGYIGLRGGIVPALVAEQDPAIDLMDPGTRGDLRQGRLVDGVGGVVLTRIAHRRLADPVKLCATFPDDVYDLTLATTILGHPTRRARGEIPGAR